MSPPAEMDPPAAGRSMNHNIEDSEDPSQMSMSYASPDRQLPMQNGKFGNDAAAAAGAMPDSHGA